MWHSHPTIVLSPPSISKDSRKHHSMDYHHYSHAHLHQLRLLHPPTVVQRQWSIVYHCNFNYSAAKAKPLYKVTVKAQVRDLRYNSGNLYPELHHETHANKLEWSPTRHLRMGPQDGLKAIRQKEVCVLRIGLMHVYYSMYFYYLLLFVIHVLSLDKLGDLLMYLSLSVLHCISAVLLYICQTVGVWIGKWLSN